MESISYLSILTSLLLVGIGVFLCLRLVRIVFRRIKPPITPHKDHDDLLVDVLRSKVEKARVAENRLSQSRRAYASLAHLYQTVTEHLPLGLVVLDAASGIQFANPRARAILDHSTSREDPQCLPTPLWDAVQRIKNADMRAKERIEIFLNQRWLTLELDLISLPDMAELLTIQDKTQIRRLEQSLQANRELTLMGEMAAGVAHEVKNVLAVVEGRAQLMALTGEIDAHRDIILKETGRLLSMVKRFMESSKREELEAEWFLAREWFEALDEVWVSRGEECRVSFEFACRRDLRVFGDPGLLGILVENLVLNGLESCGETECSDSVVCVRLEETGHQLVLTVTDQGPGFSDDILKKVFLPFVTSKEDGHGLGLFQCRKIVLAHRGLMEINKDPTRIRCVFPMSEDGDVDGASQKLHADAERDVSGRGSEKTSKGAGAFGIRSRKQEVNP